jgi:deoxyribonuclease V
MERPSGLAVCDEIRRRFSPEKAIRAQRTIARKALILDQYGPVRVVAGLDVAYKRFTSNTVGVGVAVALSYPGMRLIDCLVAVREVCIPYIPGLLAFREMAVLAPALTRLLSSTTVDLVVVDGHGIAHPRKAGIATHVGVVFNTPSIGVAKKRLTGKPMILDGQEVLVDDNGTPIAAVIRRGRGTIYVSPGHRVGLKSSVSLVRSMLRRGKLPEPTRVADAISKKFRNTLSPPRSDIEYIRCSDSSSHSISSL